MKRVTIKDVAARAGVSFGTVSRALTGHAEISQATRDKIRSICDEMGYVPNSVARGLVMKNTYTLGMIVPDISNPFFSEMYFTAEIEARKRGYRVIACSTAGEDAVRIIEPLLLRQIDGLLISPTSVASMQSIKQEIGSVPCVYLGCNNDGDCSYVSVDNVKGGYMAGQYLIDLGHRNLAFVGGRSESKTCMDRTHGFMKAIEEAGVSARIYRSRFEKEYNNRYYELASHFFDNEKAPTAIFAYSDFVALGILQAAEERGLRVPEDMSLIGFDSISYGALPRIGLTSIAHHKKMIAIRAVERLFEQIEGSNEHTTDIFEPKMMIRGSCRKI